MTTVPVRLQVRELRLGAVGQAGPRAVGGTEVWFVDGESGGVGDGGPLLGVLGPEERRRASEMREAADRATYRAAHVGLRLLVGGVLGVAPAEVAFIREPCPGCGLAHGRPAVVGGSVHFSLSHCERYAMIALSPVRVGADLERIPAGRAADAVVAALHPRERAELRALCAADRGRELARVWTRKEAYLKGLGIGLGRDVGLDYVGTARPAIAGWRLREVAAPEGYFAAVAEEEEPAGIVGLLG
ncbi:4'-phosphopantetheinyl transferase superfamily protein [Streptomyces sp. CC219B]|uniref:4'-phosphopantetheinyl transferase family protein n=1 Tax=Streptomyces sp. CC219B TaxID=3044574 RepID=UPI0024A9BA81|nr:4'-phosphopantetheinyl transferase superfamily protein [Streptomyces sp. CC219B]